MSITIHASFLPHNILTPHSFFIAMCSASRCATMSATRACAGSRSARPISRYIHRPVSAAGESGRYRRRAAYHRRDDGERHLRDDASRHEKPRCGFRTHPVQWRRGRPGTDDATVRRARLRHPRSGRQPDSRARTEPKFSALRGTSKLASERSSGSSVCRSTRCTTHSLARGTPPRPIERCFADSTL